MKCSAGLACSFQRSGHNELRPETLQDAICFFFVFFTQPITMSWCLRTIQLKQQCFLYIQTQSSLKPGFVSFCCLRVKIKWGQWKTSDKISLTVVFWLFSSIISVFFVIYDYCLILIPLTGLILPLLEVFVSSVRFVLSKYMKLMKVWLCSVLWGEHCPQQTGISELSYTTSFVYLRKIGFSGKQSLVLMYKIGFN